MSSQKPNTTDSTPKNITSPNKIDRFKANCPYSGRCSSEGYKCGSCKYNRGKEDHYEPKPYNPWICPEPHWHPPYMMKGHWY